MKRILVVLASLTLVLSTNAPAYSHGGGLDSQGGHNCRVGSCAGTYHCHQPRGPMCQKALGVVPKPSKSKKNTAW